MLRPKAVRIALISLLVLICSAVAGWLFFTRVWYGPYNYGDLHKIAHTNFVYPNSYILNEYSDAWPIEFDDSGEREVLTIELPKGVTYAIYRNFVAQQTEGSGFVEDDEPLAKYIRQHTDELYALDFSTPGAGGLISAYASSSLQDAEDEARKNHYKLHVLNWDSDNNGTWWFEGPHSGLIVDILM